MTDRMTDKQLEEMYGKPISSYTDADALEDGGLVAVSREHRVTRSVWEWMVKHLPAGDKPPNRWPVDLFKWFGAGKISKTAALELIAEHGKDGAKAHYAQMIADQKALAASLGLITTHAREAQGVYDENTGGGIFKLYAILDTQEKVDELSTTQPPQRETVNDPDIYSTLWLIPNECGGLTLMFPEDY